MIICKLCDINEADQKKSHILPKFLGISMFGNKSSRLAHRHRRDSKNQKMQDLPKEDHLFCKACETKISSIETIVAPKIRKDSHQKFNQNYQQSEDSKSLKPINLEPKEMLLFLYTIFMRLHYSNLEGFSEFVLNEDIITTIKSTIKRFLDISISKLKENIVNTNLEYLPILILTTDYTNDKQANIMTVNINKDCKKAFFICSDWFVILFQNEACSRQSGDVTINFAINEKRNDFIYLKGQEWTKFISKWGEIYFDDNLN